MASTEIMRTPTASTVAETQNDGLDAIVESAQYMEPDAAAFVRDSAQRSREWLESGEGDPSFC
jgi:hypothetical protein